ncbi:MAG: class I SAM-dependent methyltransferase [Thermoproteota archaeon]|nr:class I SAM-dependent methyltransferase [Thermoproteota archaeon]
MEISKPYFDQVANQWDMMQKSYYSNSVREKAFAMAHLREGSVAADIGAGTGFVTEGLIQSGLKVIAVDQSERMLDEMKRKFDHGAEIDYRIGQAEKLPIQDLAVDYVFANMCLHHADPPAKAISEMARILKYGGELIITDLDKHNHLFLREEHHDRWMGFDRKMVIEWLRNAGLSEVIVDSANKNCRATSSCGVSASIGIFIAYGKKG